MATITENRLTGRSSARTLVTLDTELGWMSFAEEDGVLMGLVFGHASAARAERALARLVGETAPHGDRDREPHGLADDLADRLCDYAAGEPVDFSDVTIDTAHLAPFGRRVVKACRQIPRGQTRCYGQLAAASGSPGAARAVGQVMARNRFPLVVPCHRVLAASGGLGGFSAPQGTRMKERLLAMEACAVLA